MEFNFLLRKPRKPGNLNVVLTYFSELNFIFQQFYILVPNEVCKKCLERIVEKEIYNFGNDKKT